MKIITFANVFPFDSPPMVVISYCMLIDRLTLSGGMGCLHVCFHTIGIICLTQLIVRFLGGDNSSLLLQHAFRPFQETCKYTIRLTFKYCLIVFRTTWITNTASYIKDNGSHKGAGFFQWSLLPIFWFIVGTISPVIHWDTIEKEHVQLALTRVTGSIASSSYLKSETCKHHLLDAPKDKLWPSGGKKDSHSVSASWYNS